MSESENQVPAEGPKWRPLNAIHRRVVGVLVEKAKTVPASYPLTLNALTTGCNQKSNRFPHMELSADDVLSALRELRVMGAITEVHDGGRMEKYRHRMYEWLDVDKYEMAVMTELLLRGEQTVGDLRARAARMETIQDQADLRPILQSLIQKGLVAALTPEGRGQIVTHTLYLPKEMERVRASAASVPSEDGFVAADVGSHAASSASEGAPSEMAELRAEVDALRDEVDVLRAELQALKKEWSG